MHVEIYLKMFTKIDPTVWRRSVWYGQVTIKAGLLGTSPQRKHRPFNFKQADCEEKCTTGGETTDKGESWKKQAYQKCKSTKSYANSPDVLFHGGGCFFPLLHCHTTKSNMHQPEDPRKKREGWKKQAYEK